LTQVAQTYTVKHLHGPS